MGQAYNPSSTYNRSIYGAVPETTALPNRIKDLEAAGFPVGQINSAMTGNILSDLRGEVSYDPSINFAANTGLRSGMVGSEFAARSGAADYLSRVEQAKQRGQQNALNTLGAVSNYQTVSPETQIGLDQANKILQSAPDPGAAANSALAAYQNALSRASSYYSAPTRSGGGGASAPLSQDSNYSRGYPMPQVYTGSGNTMETQQSGWGNGGTNWNTLTNWGGNVGSGGPAAPAVPSAPTSWNNITNWGGNTGSGGGSGLIINGSPQTPTYNPSPSINYYANDEPNPWGYY